VVQTLGAAQNADIDGFESVYLICVLLFASPQVLNITISLKDHIIIRTLLPETGQQKTLPIGLDQTNHQPGAILHRNIILHLDLRNINNIILVLVLLDDTDDGV
jgi:hypothetical protein